MRTYHPMFSRASFSSLLYRIRGAMCLSASRYCKHNIYWPTARTTPGPSPQRGRSLRDRTDQQSRKRAPANQAQVYPSPWTITQTGAGFRCPRILWHLGKVKKRKRRQTPLPRPNPNRPLQQLRVPIPTILHPPPRTLGNRVATRVR